MRFSITKSSLVNVFTSLFILLVFFSPIIRLAVGFVPYLSIFALMSGVVLILLVRNYYVGYKVLMPMLLFMLALLFMVAVNSSNHEAIFYLVLSLVSLMLAFWLAKQDVKKIEKLSFIALLSFYAFFVTSMITHGFMPNDINKYFIESSRNVVSATALFLQILYSAAYYRANKNLPKITPIITFVIAIIAYGRSGIALSAALVAITFLFALWQAKATYKLAYSFVIFIFFIWLLYSFSIIENIVLTETNFSTGIDTPRTLMVQQYLNSLDIFSVFAGKDLSTVPIINQYGNNPHNSFIYGHAQYGIFYLILLFGGLVAICWQVFFYKNTFIYFSLLIIFFARIFTDILSLPGIFDFIFYYMFFVLGSETAKQKHVNSH